MSTDKKFFWLDDSDVHLAERKLLVLRTKQLASWKWMRWVEDQYETPEEAIASITSEIGIPSMFDEGKVVYTFGIPKCHAAIAEHLSKIPEQILFIIIAKPNKTMSLYKVAKKMEDAGRAKIDEVGDMQSWGQSQKMDWVRTRAETLGLTMDDGTISLLLDMYGMVPNKIHIELLKLNSLVDDGQVSHWLVQQACHATGDCDVKRFCQMVRAATRDGAHELLTRLLARKEEPMAIMGFMMAWINSLCIVCDGYDEVKPLIPKMVKWKKKDDKKKKSDSQEKENSTEDDSVQNLNGETVPMFPNPGSLYYSFKDFQGSPMSAEWVRQTLNRLGYMQIEVRKAGSDWRRVSEIMHAFVNDVTGGQANGERD